MNTKVLTPVLTIVLIALGAFQAAITDGDFSDREKWQLAGLTVGAFVTYFSPLLEGKWPAALKVGGAVIGAAIVTIVGVIDGGQVWDTNTVTLVVLAALNALAAQTGADARVDKAAAGLRDTNIANQSVIAADPKAAAIAASTL